jgi:transposase-like protein
MTPIDDDKPTIDICQDDFQAMLRDQVRLAVRYTLITILNEEVDAFVGADRYERTDQRRDQRNGTYPRSLGTTVGQIEDLPVPRTRKGFRSQVFDRYQRRRAELDQGIGEMFVQGVSTPKVGQVMEALTDIKPSPSTVSRVFHTLDGEYTAWKQRCLDAHYVYAFADGTYFTVIYDNEGHKMPILAVAGINQQGERQVLGFTVGERENQGAWEELLDDLKRRGVQQVDLWVTDGNQAMLNAISLKFSASQRQRCVKHKMDNVLGYVPTSQQASVEPELKAIFYQDDREKADQAVAAFIEKYRKTYPTAVECLQRDLEACLTFYAFPSGHWKTIRTTNVIERLFGEVKKRSHKMAAAFRNEGSCLLMFYAVIRGLTFKRIPMPAKQPGSELLHRI